MKAALFVSALALATSASAARINKVRRDAPTYDAAPSYAEAPPSASPAPGYGSGSGSGPSPSDNSGVPSYTLYYTSQLAGSQSDASVDGNVYVSLQQGDVLISVQVVNPADDAACFVRDAQNNQIRAFGGPDQDVDAIQFQFDDGKQARSISCSPA